MPNFRCCYHFVWATWQRQPMILPQRAPVLFTITRSVSEQLNAPVFALNAMPDHVHLAVQVPPTIALSLYIQRIKGRSAHDWNDGLAVDEPKLRWQQGYGVITFGDQQLAAVRDYIDRQEQHYQAGTYQEMFESVGDGV